ncbi:efflux RND transporter periplasmic adaptor subunit [Leptobacterium flavescens]|uniref:Efflux RND transporter periplasmic adaptor subunit n=1 Tax=Leptobacterium flavescens TaxID=472055 RepID=A0A6P0UEZ1_9FLAO|nr:efflux RND transporter periplasmic adaptor subunit [Leptobacterium flavescens]NER11834.1 efflux RND transporter periplasmic adaptor subunit [Leptobacterium flavescens]
MKPIYSTFIFILFSITFYSCDKAKAEKKEESSNVVANTENKTGKAHANQEALLSPQQFEALNIKADTLAKRSMTFYVEANGQLEVPPQNEATVTTSMGANVVAIEVIEGDEIKKEQLLGYISHPDIIKLQTDYLNAYNNGIFLEKEYRRQKKLFEGGVGSGMNYQKAEAQYKASRGLIDGLKAQLRLINLNPSKVQAGTIFQRAAIFSPIEGFVQKVKVRIGQYVEPQTDLFEIVDTDHIHADLMIYEKDVHRVMKGQSVSFSVQSVPGMELNAKIISVGKTFEEANKAVHVHAEITNKQEGLIPGMYVEGKIATSGEENIALPEDALVEENGKLYAFSVKKEGDKWSFVPREVIRGAQEGKWISVNFVDPPKQGMKFAYNNAYYLMAEMKKGDAEHSH